MAENSKICLVGYVGEKNQITIIRNNTDKVYKNVSDESMARMLFAITNIMYNITNIIGEDEMDDLGARHPVRFYQTGFCFNAEKARDLVTNDALERIGL